MGIRMSFIVIWGFLIFSCKKNSIIPTSDKLNSNSIQIDSISLRIVGKPGWIERDHYPEEKISIVLDNGKFNLMRDSFRVLTQSLKQGDLDSLNILLNRLDEAQIDRIYNAEQFWLPDIELYAFCSPIEKSFMIKSFGNIDEVPQNIQELNSFLLREMRKGFRKVR